MGYSTVLGVWSIASAHHEHTVCDITGLLCHHVIDSWEKAEFDARSSFIGGQATMSVSNYTIGNAGYYQGIFFDGNATMIQLRPPSGHYMVVFGENGLRDRTSWSVTVNGTTVTSTRSDIVFLEPNGTYVFKVGTPSGFNASPSSGTLTVNGQMASESIVFRTPPPYLEYIAGAALASAILGVLFLVFRLKRRSGSMLFGLRQASKFP